MVFYLAELKFLPKLLFNKIWPVLICSRRVYGSPRQYMIYYIAFTMFLSAIFSIFYCYMYISRPHIADLEAAHRMIQDRLKENLIKEKGLGCRMPEINPFSEEVMAFNQDLPKVKCEGTDIVQCYKSECYVDKEMLKNMKDVVCKYRDIIYITDQLYFVDINPVKVHGSDKYVLNQSDHIVVSCKWTDVNSLGILSSRWYGYKVGFRPVKPDPVPPGRQNPYNVLILGFDSASHNGFIRKMPKSYKYLSEKAIILNSYNIVGDGTPAALFPILTGLAEEELPDARKHLNNSYFNAKQFLFLRLKKYGYRTAYFEDSPEVGTFQYRFNGFRRQPADHYLRAFLLEYGRRPKFGNPSSKHCIGDTPLYQLFMNLADEFHSLDGKKFSFTFIAEISHDNFNLISSADDSLLTFLQNLVAKDLMEDTLVMIMSDHGTRYEGMRSTYQGKLEERLPLMAIILPEKLKTARPDAVSSLIHNSDVLTTPFDIHATLLDFLDLNDLAVKWKIPGSDLPRAMSLLNPIPASRTCSEAGVMPHWCACIRWTNVSRSDPLFKEVADVLAGFIDGIAKQQPLKCSRRVLYSVEWVLRQTVNDQLLKYKMVKEEDPILGNPSGPDTVQAPSEYYQAKVVMLPGNSVFEGTVTYLTKSNTYVVNKKFISRVNVYGDEANCISDTYPELNKFCYCNDKVLNTTAMSKAKEFNAMPTN